MVLPDVVADGHNVQQDVLRADLALVVSQLKRREVFFCFIREDINVESRSNNSEIKRNT